MGGGLGTNLFERDGDIGMKLGLENCNALGFWRKLGSSNTDEAQDDTDGKHFESTVEVDTEVCGDVPAFNLCCVSGVLPTVPL